MKKILFLDRDGIINIDMVDVYRKEDFIFTKDIIDVCSYARDKGFGLIVISNQTGISRGVFSKSDVETLHVWVKKTFATYKIDILDFYYCADYDSPCRKPAPGMILQAVLDHDVDVTKSIMVGDKLSDRIQLPGLQSIIVKSRYCKTGYDIASLNDLKQYL